MGHSKKKASNAPLPKTKFAVRPGRDKGSVKPSKKKEKVSAAPLRPHKQASIIMKAAKKPYVPVIKNLYVPAIKKPYVPVINRLRRPIIPPGLEGVTFTWVLRAEFFSKEKFDVDSINGQKFTLSMIEGAILDTFSAFIVANNGFRDIVEDYSPEWNQKVVKEGGYHFDNLQDLVEFYEELTDVKSPGFTIFGAYLLGREEPARYQEWVEMGYLENDITDPVDHYAARVKQVEGVFQA